MLFDHLHIFFGEMSTQILCPFFYWFVFLLLTYKNSLHILYRSSLSDISFASIFSYSVVCLFIFFIVSFVPQNFFFLTSLLEYNCFIVLCQFLLYNKVNQLYIYIYPHDPPSCVSLPPSLSHLSRWSQSTKLISLCHAAASHQLSILHLEVYICQCQFLTSSQLTLPPPCVLKSILYVCVFIPARPLGSSVPFFQIPYMCISIRYLFFSF